MLLIIIIIYDEAKCSLHRLLGSFSCTFNVAYTTFIETSFIRELELCA